MKWIVLGDFVKKKKQNKSMISSYIYILYIYRINLVRGETWFVEKLHTAFILITYRYLYKLATNIKPFDKSFWLSYKIFYKVLCTCFDVNNFITSSCIYTLSAKNDLCFQNFALDALVTIQKLLSTFFTISFA